MLLLGVLSSLVGGNWVDGVPLPLLDVLAKMEGPPNHQVGLGVALRGAEGVRRVDTNMFRSMLRGSSFVESRIGQS